MLRSVGVVASGPFSCKRELGVDIAPFGFYYGWMLLRVGAPLSSPNRYMFQGPLLQRLVSRTMQDIKPSAFAPRDILQDIIHFAHSARRYCDVPSFNYTIPLQQRIGAGEV